MSGLVGGELLRTRVLAQNAEGPSLGGWQPGASLVVPFAAYVAAEHVEASGVLAVVVSGLLLGHKAPILQGASSRIAERMNWRTLAFLLENAVFLLIGLQARWLLDDVGASDAGWRTSVAVCAATLATVVVLRLVWVFPVRYLLVRPGPGWSGRLPPASLLIRSRPSIQIVASRAFFFARSLSSSRLSSLAASPRR